MKTQNIETRVFQSSEMRADAEKRTIAGYAAVFGMESEDLGGFTEVIAPGAFDSVLGDDVRALVNHEDSKVLARTKSGTLRLDVDANGLRYEFDVPNTTYGNDLLESVRRGDISQSSFGFVVEADEWDYQSNGMGKKKPKRTITKVGRLFDVSPVTYPAYPDTSVAMRSLKQLEEAPEVPAANIEEEHARKARAISLLHKKMKL